MTGNNYRPAITDYLFNISVFKILQRKLIIISKVNKFSWLIELMAEFYPVISGWIFVLMMKNAVFILFLHA